MKYIIEALLTDDEGQTVTVHEEFDDRNKADRRYTQLALNYDEPISWKEIK